MTERKTPGAAGAFFCIRKPRALNFSVVYDIL